MNVEAHRDEAPPADRDRSLDKDSADEVDNVAEVVALPREAKLELRSRVFPGHGKRLAHLDRDMLAVPVGLARHGTAHEEELAALGKAKSEALEGTLAQAQVWSGPLIQLARAQELEVRGGVGSLSLRI